MRSISSSRSKFFYERFFEPTAKTMVLSDVDGTLLRGSLVLDHACLLHENGTVDLGEAPAAWLRDPKNEELITALANVYRDKLVGLRASELFVTPFIDSVVGSPEKIYSTLERLQRHRKSGHRVTLISGSPSFLLKPFARRFGFEAVGSLYHRDRNHRFTGEVTAMFGAEHKEKVVSQMPLESYQRIIGYGDTASDIPLLSVANHSVLVDPNKETLKKFQELKISEILLK